MKKWKTAPNYVVFYILLLGMALNLFRSNGAGAGMIPYLLTVSAMIDLAFSKNRSVTIANWIPIVAICGILFLVRACLDGNWVRAVLYALAVLTLAVGFVHIWKKEL